MQGAKSLIDSFRQLTGRAVVPGALLLIALLGGCNTVTTNGTQSGSGTTTTGPQTYFAPIVAGTTYNSSGGAGGSQPLTTVLAYALDDTAQAFSQTTYQPLTQPGPQVLNAGNLAMGQRGLRNLGITANYIYNNNVSPAAYVPVYFNPAETGSFAVELADQAGALVQLLGQPAAPMAASTACPSSGSSQTYLFLTIPGGLTTTSGLQYAWDPATDTAYGVVQVSSSDSEVTLQNIQQYILPSGAATTAPVKPVQPGPASVTGTCGSTFFGYITVVPGQLVIGDPGTSTVETIPPQATLAIGPTGLLVEDNGSNATSPLPNTSPALHYNNALGAGTGAVGLPQPSSPLSTNAVVGAQYLGFIYGAGVYTSSRSQPNGWSSTLTSFGFPNTPNCSSSFPASTGTQVYGGDYNPSTSTTGYSNCDLAVDLGTQSPSTNGLYPNATVWMDAGYAANPTRTTYSFSAVAIAGQLNGKYAIFVLGVDNTASPQPWAIYLLQSN